MTKRHLRLRGDTWYFNYAVPKNLQPILHKKNVTKSLNTDSLKQARIMRDRLLKEYEALILSHGVNHEGKRLRALVKEIRTQYGEAKTEDELWALDDKFNAEYESDPLKADAILIATDGNPTSPNTGISIEYTLGELCSNYLATIEDNRSTQSIATTKRAVRYFKEFNKHKDALINNINRLIVTKFITYLRNDAGVGHKSISNILSSLNKIHQYALNHGHTAQNSPFNSHAIEKTTGDDVQSYRPFTPPQFNKLMSVVKESTRITYARKWFAPMLLMTGLRPKELAGLYKEDLEEMNNNWFIRVHATAERKLKTKNASRLVPIHTSVLKAFLTLRDNSSNKFLFEEVDGLKNVSATIGQWFSKMKTKHITPDKDIALYSLRGMFATACEHAGVEERTTAYLMGHSRTGVSMAYGIYSTGAKSEELTTALNLAGDELAPFTKHFPKH